MSQDPPRPTAAVPRRVTGWFRAALVAAGLCLGCGGEESVVPNHLQGIWTTDAPRYGHRYLELRGRHVLFGIDDETVVVYTVRQVQETPEENGVLYTISYGDDEGSDFRLLFYHGKEGADEIVFKHQDHLRWTRADH